MQRVADILSTFARMSSSPLPKNVTRPLEDTFASTGFDDCQAAALVTSRVVPSDIRAVATSWS